MDPISVIARGNYNMEQKGTLQLLIKMLKTTDKLSKGLGGLKCCSLGLVGKSLQSRVGFAHGAHGGFKGLGRCQGTCRKTRGLWTRTKAASYSSSSNGEGGKDRCERLGRDKVHSRA